MLSRIADSLFWLNRYMERTDGLMRVIRTNYILSFEIVKSNDFPWRTSWKYFHYCSKTQSMNGENTAAALKYLIADTKNLNSVKVLVIEPGKMQEVCRII